MSYKVLLAQSVAQKGIDLLKENGYEVVLAPEENKAVMMEYIKDCDAVFSKTYFLDEDILKAGKKLKVVAKHGVGIDNVVDIKTATALGLYVVNTPLANMDSVAEHTIAGILTFTKHIIDMDKATRVYDFAAPDRTEIHEVKESTIGLIGLGNIGKSVARKALAFDMKVLAYDPFLPANKVPEGVTMVETLEEIYRNSDYISLHVGANEHTIRMISSKQLQMMKKSAVLCNFARGALVIEEDLVEALKNGTIRGAIVDVYEHEPLQENCPLLELDNVLLSPHSAALTVEALDRMSYQGAQGIVSILSGERPKWCPNYDAVNTNK